MHAAPRDRSIIRPIETWEEKGEKIIKRAYESLESSWTPPLDLNLSLQRMNNRIYLSISGHHSDRSGFRHASMQYGWLANCMGKLGQIDRHAASSLISYRSLASHARVWRETGTQERAQHLSHRIGSNNFFSPKGRPAWFHGRLRARTWFRSVHTCLS